MIRYVAFCEICSILAVWIRLKDNMDVSVVNVLQGTKPTDQVGSPVSREVLSDSKYYAVGCSLNISVTVRTIEFWFSPLENRDRG